LPNLAPNVQKILAAKAINGKQTEYRINGSPGLILIVQPTGGAAFFFYYRRRTKLRKVRIASREGFNLSDVKAVASELRARTDSGGDPVLETPNPKYAHLANILAFTFDSLFAARLANDQRLKASTKKLYSGLYRRHVQPAIGDIAVAGIKRKDVVALLDKITGKKGLRLKTADHAKNLISGTYRWGLKVGQIEAPDPAFGLSKRSVEITRDRVLSGGGELAQFWQGLHDPSAPLSQPLRFILKLALLTAQRRTEIASVTIKAIEFDNPDGPVWRMRGDSIKKGKRVEGETKSGRAHLVPLSPQAAELFRIAIKEFGNGTYVFASPVTAHTPRMPHIDPHSCSRAVRRIRDHLGIDDIRLHDLRRTCASHLAENGVRTELISQLLNHATDSRNVTQSVYVRSQSLPELRAATTKWADYLDGLADLALQGGDPLPVV